MGIKTLTPLWTGGVNRDCDRLHETGLIGSLRWWFEVVVRGLGGYACDPTGKEKEACDLDEARYMQLRREGKSPMEAASEAGLCRVCLLFGTTGWQRAFRLEVEAASAAPVASSPKQRSPEQCSPKPLLLPSGRCHGQRAGGWYVLPGMYGDFTVLLHFRPEGEKEWPLLAGVLKLMEHWTAIGAKATGGYGVFRIDRIEDGRDFDQFLEQEPSSLDSAEGDSGEGNSTELPRLTDGFFAKVRFKPCNDDWWQQFREVRLALAENPPCGDHKSNRMDRDSFQCWLDKGVFPISPIVRNWLRYSWFSKLGFSVSEEELLFGVVKGNNRRRTAIGISHAYQVGDKLWEFRVWGCRPPELKDKWQEFVEKLYEALQEPNNASGGKKGLPSIWDKPDWKEENKNSYRNDGGLFGEIAEIVKPEGIVWREFNSDRDTVSKLDNKWEFFISLTEERVK
ncbi:type III-B CRISPR module RAMP protein Cmr1 [Ammonifex thiophilus]|uniref:Type III-B CRISPR module RAMP protein Cmr1 n=1 Tax=Ammonifex thiophilus TaxID=444093 RepID=A0A3D8P3Q0_9THEO|nr:type III-B CRISPR module RAMP protein Cmr1 [Ammonifex thiophilus]